MIIDAILPAGGVIVAKLQRRSSRIRRDGSAACFERVRSKNRETRERKMEESSTSGDKYN